MFSGEAWCLSVAMNNKRCQVNVQDNFGGVYTSNGCATFLWPWKHAECRMCTTDQVAGIRQ